MTTKEEMATIVARANERAAVVHWLRAQSADQMDVGVPAIGQFLAHVAEAINRGEHLEAGNGTKE